MKTRIEELLRAERAVVVSNPRWVGNHHPGVIRDGMRVFEYRHDVHVENEAGISVQLIDLFKKIKDHRNIRYENGADSALMIWDAVHNMDVACMRHAHSMVESPNPSIHPFKLAQRHQACQVCAEACRDGSADPILTESLEFLISLYLKEHNDAQKYLDMYADHITDTMVHQQLRHGKKTNGKTKK